MVSAAIMAEAVGLIGKGSLEGIPFEAQLSRCVRQGTIEAVKLFNATVLRLLSPLCEAWSQAAYGIFTSHSRAILYVWADNI